MTSLAAGPPLLLSEFGQYLIESLSVRAGGGGHWSTASTDTSLVNSSLSFPLIITWYWLSVC